MYLYLIDQVLVLPIYLRHAESSGLASLSAWEQVDPWDGLFPGLSTFSLFLLLNLFHLMKKNLYQEEGLSLAHQVFQTFRCNGGGPVLYKDSYCILP